MSVFSTGPGQGVLGKFVDDMWTKSWFTKEPIGTFLFAICFPIINSSSVNTSLSYVNTTVTYIYMQLYTLFYFKLYLKILYFVNSSFKR